MNIERETRIGDAEREAAAAALGEHFAAGRLTKPEYDDRVEVVWGARTASELRPLFVDLPSAGPSGTARQQRAQAPERTGRRTWGWAAALPVPLLLVAGLAVVAVLAEMPWLLFVFGWMFFCGPWRRRCP